MIWLAILSATTGVFNFMWTIFQLLGGVPSFVLEATMTLVYLLEPCFGFVLAGYGWFVGVPVDRSFWLQFSGYSAELITGILNVLKLQA